jgi:pimeloyl-ACP methyl ester carboxylesterase
MPIANGMYYAEYQGSNSTLPPVVLIHGAGSDHLCWPVNLRRLNGFRVLAPDFPGHGRSAGVSRQLVREYAADLIAFLDALEIFSAVLVGHSLGGSVALETALQHPAQVVALALISTAAHTHIPTEFLNYLSAPASVKNARHWLQERLLSPESSPTLVKKSNAALENVRQEVLHNDWKAVAAFDLCDRVKEISQPARVICGKNDRIVPLAGSRHLAASLPNAQIQVIPNAGHLVLLEKPDEVASGVQSFLHNLNI